MEYIEEREYISERKEKKRRFFRKRYPSEFKEQVRYYYRSYLKKLSKKQVKLLKSDTSLQVNEKAKEIFPNEIIEIRAIYINSRYGNKEVNKEMVEEMKILYREL